MSEPGKPAPSPDRKAILILGMHRSGTSAVAGVVNALGAGAPRTLMATDQFNPRGYFESSALSAAFDEMLASTGSRWHDWRELNLRPLTSDPARQHRVKITALIRAEYGDEPLIFIKDPRICRFIPFMAAILDELNFATVAILPIRNPLEVASSLKRRDNLAPAKSILLWLRHVLDAERHSRNMPRAFVSYAEFLTDWRKHMARAGEKTGIVWPRQCERTAAEIDLFLRSGAPHESTSVDEPATATTRLAREAYRLISEIAAGDETPDLLDRLDSIRSKFDERCELFGAATVDDELSVEQLRGQVGAQHVQIDALHAEVRWRHGEIDRLHKEVNRCEGTIQHLHAEVKKRDADIQWLHDEIKRRDADIAWLHDEVKRRDADIGWLHGEVKQRDAEIKRLHGDATRDDGADADEGLTPAHADAKPNRA